MRRWGSLVGLLALVGCMSQQTRLQSDEEVAERPQESEVRVVGDSTTVANAEPVALMGVGLVTGLENTGGGVPLGADRTMLEEHLKRLQVENLKELYASPTTSLVRVMAYVPPGARKGDRIDVTISVPDGVRTSSLRGGKLEECVLYNFDSTQRMTGDASRPDRLLRGHIQAKASGPVLIEATEGDGTAGENSQRLGRVWAGAKYAGDDRALSLYINDDLQNVRTAIQIAARVNETFSGPTPGNAAPLATAKNNRLVTLAVPGAYKLNLGRYLRVVRLVPLAEAQPTSGAYAQKLEQQLLDPSTCVTSALRLEALGAQSIPSLKLGLQSSHPMVRFAAAEALAYLGSPACGEELAKQVVEQPFVQAFALTALASLNEAVCHVKLQELLTADRPDTRFGAYRALRALDDRSAAVAGQKLNGFWLHELAKETPPQVHLATAGRAEVVLFGSTARFVGPLSVLAGPEFTLTVEPDAQTCTLTRFTPAAGKQPRPCTTDVAEVLQALSAMGGTYSDAVELLKQADAAKGMNCALSVDALPKAPTVYDLAKAGLPTAPGKLGGDIGVTPTLYETPAKKK